jgi:hypothetical protein
VRHDEEARLISGRMPFAGFAFKRPSAELPAALPVTPEALLEWRGDFASLKAAVSELAALKEADLSTAAAAPLLQFAQLLQLLSQWDEAWWADRVVLAQREPARLDTPSTPAAFERSPAPASFFSPSPSRPEILLRAAWQRFESTGRKSPSIAAAARAATAQAPLLRAQLGAAREALEAAHAKLAAVTLAGERYADGAHYTHPSPAGGSRPLPSTSSASSSHL